MQLSEDNSTIKVEVIYDQRKSKSVKKHVELLGMGNFLLSAFSCSSQLSIQDLFVNTLKVVLGRRLLGVFMTVYMPTILMNIVGHSTIYFRPFLFEAQVKTRMIMLLNQISGVCQSDSDAGPHNNVCQVHDS